LPSGAPQHRLPIGPAWLDAEFDDQQTHDVGKAHGAGNVHLCKGDALVFDGDNAGLTRQMKVREANRTGTGRMPVKGNQFATERISDFVPIAPQARRESVFGVMLRYDLVLAAKR
jgi:hypothetical protein